MKKCYILGASGFIGQHLTRGFKKKSNIETNAFSSSQCNLLSLSTIKASLADAGSEDVILVCSAIPRMQNNSYDAMSQNIEMIHNLCRYLATKPVGHVLFFSSVEIYGKVGSSQIISEQLSPDPVDYYAISKFTGECLLKKLQQSTAIPCTILRLPGVFGPGGSGRSTINNLIACGQETGEITIHGDGGQKRDFIFVQDLYPACDHLITTRPNVTINVVSGISLTINHIAKLIVESLPNSCKIKKIPMPETQMDRNEHMVFDNQRLRRLIPGIKMTNLEQAIAKTIRTEMESER